MQSTDRVEFVQAIAALAATFRQEATEALIEGYWLGLEDLDVRAVKGAAVQAMRQSRYMPAVAELRELAGVLAPADRAVLAWNVVQKARAIHGYYDSVDFDDPVINATIRTLGGWERFEERFDRDEVKWIRQDFEKTYAALCRSGISEELAAPLVGHFDRVNRFNGFLDTVKEPVAIACELPPHGQEVLRVTGRKQAALPEEAKQIGRMP